MSEDTLGYTRNGIWRQTDICSIPILNFSCDIHGELQRAKVWLAYRSIWGFNQLDYWSCPNDIACEVCLILPIQPLHRDWNVTKEWKLSKDLYVVLMVRTVPEEEVWFVTVRTFRMYRLDCEWAARCLGRLGGDVVVQASSPVAETFNTESYLVRVVQGTRGCAEWMPLKFWDSRDVDVYETQGIVFEPYKNAWWEFDQSMYAHIIIEHWIWTRSSLDWQLNVRTHAKKWDCQDGFSLTISQDTLISRD